MMGEQHERKWCCGATTLRCTRSLCHPLEFVSLHVCVCVCALVRMDGQTDRQAHKKKLTLSAVECALNAVE